MYSFASQAGFPTRVAALFVDLKWCTGYDERQLFRLVRTLEEPNAQEAPSLYPRRLGRSYRYFLPSTLVCRLTHVHIHPGVSTNIGRYGSAIRSIPRSIPNIPALALETYGSVPRTPLDVLIDFVAKCPALFYLALNFYSPS